MRRARVLGGSDLPPLPFESTRSAMARFGWRHGFDPTKLVKLCNTHERDSAEGLPPRLPQGYVEHYRLVRQWLKKLSAEREFMKMNTGEFARFQWIEPQFRFCPCCLEACYHSFLFQWSRMEVCPLHGCHLMKTCLHCGRPVNGTHVRASIGLVGYRCIHCMEPIAGGTPSLGLHQQLQIDSAHLAAVMGGPARQCETLFNRLTFLCSPAEVFIDQAKGSLRQWQSRAHILHAAEQAISKEPLRKGATHAMGMTFILWSVSDYEQQWQGFDKTLWANDRKRHATNLSLAYAATRRRLANWVFAGKSAEAEDRRLCATLETVGDNTCVGDWDRLELTYLIFRISIETGNLRPVSVGIPPSLRITPRALELWGCYSHISLIAYRAWLLATFAVIHAYLGMRASMTIDEALMVPGFPETLVPIFSTRKTQSLLIEGGVYFPTIIGMPLYPFKPSARTPDAIQ